MQVNGLAPSRPYTLLGIVEVIVKGITCSTHRAEELGFLQPAKPENRRTRIHVNEHFRIGIAKSKSKLVNSIRQQIISQ